MGVGNFIRLHHYYVIRNSTLSYVYMPLSIHGVCGMRTRDELSWGRGFPLSDPGIEALDMQEIGCKLISVHIGMLFWV